MQFKVERRAFLKAGVNLISCYGLRNVVYSTAAYGSLSSTISHAGCVNDPVTADSISVTVDSVFLIISDECLPLDSDGDGLSDDDEVALFITDPLNPDTDGDGLSDGDEVMIYNTLPRRPDSDFDGFSDAYEISAGTNARNKNFFPLTDGDVNLDGQVNAADSLSATRIIHGDITATPEQLQHGDVAPLVNGFPSPDGKITTGDLVVILRKALGLVEWR